MPRSTQFDETVDTLVGHAREYKQSLRLRWMKDCVGYDCYNNQWYWHDETYYIYGPFDSEHEARIEMAIYCHFNLGT